MNETDIIYYFAYGSNMSTARLQARVPSAQRIGVFNLPEYILDFSMHGFDDSAKCNGRKTGKASDALFGVLFSMQAQERKFLDFHEQLGEGYELIHTSVFDQDNNTHPCFLYTALRLQTHLLPFDWYHHHVLFGAKEARLPSAVIANLEQVNTSPDTDLVRSHEQMSIY